MDKINQIRKDFNKNSKELAKYFKQFYKIKDDDIDFFCYKSYDYDYLPYDEQEELENIVLNNSEFFKFINKCKNNILLIQRYNVTDKFTKKELDLYVEMYNVLGDMQFSKQFKVNLMKKTMIKNDTITDETENNFEV